MTPGRRDGAGPSVPGMPTASEQIIAEVTAWPGITAVDGTRGELSFRLGKREIGHLHGDRSAHFAFPREVAEELRAAGRVGPHPAFPGHPKLAARRIKGPADVADVIAMLRMNYDREVARTPAGAA
jgi:hypothetical protein